MTDGDRATVVLGVTGCIAAYKACELARELGRRGYRVKTVMTEAATRFVGPATFRALTGEPVSCSLWEDPASASVHHISLAEEADVLVVAPATANVIAKLSQGRADDLLTTTVLASEAPLVVAPAMNVHMWRKDITQENVRVLAERGAVVVGPDTGELACGEEGEGRLAPVAEIADAVEAEAARTRSLAAVRLVVTAGGTQEPVDPVRFIGNRSSGKTGYAIADEAARRGAAVTLVSAPTALPAPVGVELVSVTTAAEMRDAVLAEAEGCHAVVMTAAVADFRPASPSVGKLKKEAALATIELDRTEDILAELGERKGGRVLVGFAAETGDPIPAARAKLERKHLDLVVANDVSDPDLGFGSDANRVALVTAEGVEELPLMSKREIARVLLDRLADVLGPARGSGGG